MSRFVGDVHNYVNAQGEVVRYAPCHRCSQNLRGSTKGSKCPRCGAPVAFSICGNYLCFYSPRWLGNIASGVRIVLWGTLASMALRLAAAMLLDDSRLLGALLACGGAAVACWGAWLMTMPDPGGTGGRMYNRARLLLWATLLAQLVATAAYLLVMTDRPSSAAGQIATGLLLLLCGLLTILCEFAKLHFIQHLAMRIPDQALAWRAGGLKWAMLAVSGLFAVYAAMAAASLFTMDFDHPPQIGNFGGAMGVALTIACLFVPLCVVLMILTVMILDVLYRTARAVQDQIPLAIDAWKSAKSGIPGNRTPSDPTATTPSGTASALLDAPAIHQPSYMFPLAESWNKQAEDAPVTPLKVAHLAKRQPPVDPPGA